MDGTINNGMGRNMIPEFIRIEHTLEAAMTYRNSGQEDPATFRFDGVQLLPNNIYPYIQRTHNSEGIELENWQVWVMDLCGNILEDITDYFFVTRVFQDAAGLPQIEWELRNVPFDFSDRLIYLQILQGANDYMYTSPFKLTAYESDDTSRWDYKNASDDNYMSVQLRVFFRQPMGAINLTTYKALNTGRQTMQNVKKTPFEKWKTGLVDKFVFQLISDLFLCRFLYCDFQRTGLYDVYDTPEIEFDENFMEQTIMLARDPNDTYDPLYVAPTPPAPPIPVREIILDSVVSLNNNEVQFNFHYENFVPTFIFVEYASNPFGPWTQVNGSPDSPRTMNVPNNLSGDFYYRVSSVTYNVVSNILQLPQMSITITNIVGAPGVFVQNGNKYYITYTHAGFTIESQLSFECSIDDVNWIPIYYDSGNQNPKSTYTPSSTTEFKYFRIKYNPLGLVSPSYFFEF